ncbi:putative sugar O-methyltransferase [Rhodospirillales bacterium]|nr:putative sugar O-methyltransferase [Rhodospirillales bacterium]
MLKPRYLKIRYGVVINVGIKSINTKLMMNEDAIDHLLAQAENDENSTSAYWDEHKSLFKVQPDGTVIGNSVLGNASTKRSILRDAAHFLLQLPLKKWARHYDALGYSEKLGRKLAKQAGRQFTYDFLRHVFTLALIQQYRAEITTTGNTLVIGDGFGTMASLILGNSPDTRAIVVNLTKPLILDLIYLKRTFPSCDIALVSSNEEMDVALKNPNIRVIAVQADDCDILYQAPIDLAINIVSMQEMDMPIVEKYFDILRRNPAEKTAFYCCNRRVKTSNFEEFPWDSKDLILEDGICEWSQHYYSNKWPFIHRRTYGGRTVMHRFVELKK